MKADVSDVTPLFANVIGVATGPGMVRVNLGESLDGVNKWHTAVYLPMEVAKALGGGLLNITSAPKEMTEQ